MDRDDRIAGVVRTREQPGFLEIGQTALDLRISPELRQMDPRLFRPERIGLALAENGR